MIHFRVQIWLNEAWHKHQSIISTNFLTTERAGALVDKILNADFCAIQKVENQFIRKVVINHTLFGFNKNVT